MSNKPKIAICVSGQTRHLNQRPRFMQDFFDILDLFRDFDYDLYGHTWADQETPNNKVLKLFTDFQKEDQAIIWQELTTNKVVKDANIHFSEFISWRSEWYNESEYTDTLNSKGDFIEFAKQRIYGNLGQIWSAHRCFQQIDFSTEYLFVVRLRWDLQIDTQSTDHAEFKKLLKSFAGMLDNVLMQRHTLDVLATNQSYIEPKLPFIDDFLFVINTNKVRELIIHNPVKIFTEMANNKSDRLTYRSGGAFPSSHTLWAYWLKHVGWSVYPILPVGLYTTSNGVTPTNKKWKT